MEGFKENPSKLCQQGFTNFFYRRPIGVYGFSEIGKNHKKRNSPGQDANCIDVANKNNHSTIIASIADGSTSFSR